MNLPKPNWLKFKLPQSPNYLKIKSLLTQYNLHTVCVQARCPNLGECWDKKTATFMILGDLCSRHCQFCAVAMGKPSGIVDEKEPKRLAQAVKELALKYVVITSVTRDDLPWGGAEIFAKTILEIKHLNPKTTVEVLIPDFTGNRQALQITLAGKPDVLAHNLETVARLTPLIRDQKANYQTSLQILSWTKEINPQIKTKSGFMLGLGETDQEIFETLCDLKQARVDIITIGQYLQPTKKNLPVSEYLRPEKFAAIQKVGLSLGFNAVLAGPLVRSSFNAAELFARCETANKRLFGSPFTPITSKSPFTGFFFKEH